LFEFLTNLLIIGIVQAGLRAFIVDNCPAHQQELANAWASRMTGVGSIMGYIFGYLDLRKIFPFLGNTQFKVLCALASIFLTVTLALSCWYIQERDPRLDGPPSSDGLGLVSFFKQAFKSIRNLPPQIARVCEVQVAAWVGWFPFLFYSTTYIGQLYVNPIFAEHPDLPDDQIDRTWEDATRIGALALLIYAIISFVATIILPLLVVPTYESKEPDVPHAECENQFEEEEEPIPRRLSFSSMPTGTAEEPLMDALVSKSVDSGRSTWLSRLQIPGLTLRRTWLLSHILFALCMFSTFFISYYPAGSIVIGFVGISWAVTLWAPFALISAEVSRIEVQRRLNRHRSTYTEGSTQHNSSSGSYAAVAVEDEHEDHDISENDLEEGPKHEPDNNLIQAGIVLGIHNVAVSFPQIFSSLACSAIFKMAQKPRGAPWDDSVGWVLRFGGCAALVAAWLTRRLSEGSHRS
jgi:solute carrier family 45 protein 1/2/4